MKEKILKEWNNILSLEKTSPYAFRTRLERTLCHTVTYANKIADSNLSALCAHIIDKMRYISDQSNQTSEGCLNSYICLKSDMLNIIEAI